MLELQEKPELFDFENAFDPDYYLYFYEAILTQARLKAELDFLVRFTHLDAPKKILDLACGHGRHSNELAKLGHTVTGIDASFKFLERAKSAAIEEGIDVEYVHGDMKKQISFEHYERIYVLFNALGYFNDDENEQVFRNLHQALKPGGLLCFDTHNRDTFQTYYQPFSVMEKKGDLMIDRNTFDTLTGRCWTQRTILKNNQIKSFKYSVRFYNPTDILQLFKQLGFTSCAFYGDWDGSQLDKSSKRMIVIARK